MARNSQRILDSGDVFPALGLDTLVHGRIELPDHWAGRYGVLLVYRAGW